MLRAGGGGGCCLSPWNGGGTPNLRAWWDSDSSIGCLGGRGGGAGPVGARLEEPRGLVDGEGDFPWSSANFPAVARGGGALNLGAGGPLGGDDSLAGLAACPESARPPPLRGPGGAGGGPLLFAPECCGLSDTGAGGGFCFRPLAFSVDFFELIHVFMKSAFSAS